MFSKERSRVEINLDAFEHNLRSLKSFLRADQQFLQIVKADAYGHGALEIAKIALENGAAMLGVANLEEGRYLRMQGLDCPILILSPVYEDEIPDIIKYRLTPGISDPDIASKLEAAASSENEPYPYHLKIDTGMHRLGVPSSCIEVLLQELEQYPHIRLEGVFSHFAASEADHAFSLSQEVAFAELMSKLGSKPRYIHFANSSAVVNGLGLEYNLVRFGILSYGIYTHPDQIERIDLQPVMRFKSSVSQIKTISKGEALGYSLSWKASRETRYGVVPVGYADGYDFLLSSKGFVEIHGKLCPVIGRISMDMITVDLTDLSDASVGDEVILLGGTKPETRAEQLSALYQGSAYELLCQLGRRARRHYYQDGNLVTSSPLSRRDFVPSDFSDLKLSSIIESAVLQRLGSEEIGSLVYREILSNLFFDKDRDIHYRKDFKHSIELIDGENPHYFQALTELSYRKILDAPYFMVACAHSEAALQNYFRRRDVEYRWLMDTSFDLSSTEFEISSVKVNELVLQTRVQVVEGCLEIYCSHPQLVDLVGEELSFEINTRTLYPRSSHQMSIFITELTKGVSLSFSPPACVSDVECIPVFSGQNRFPKISRIQRTISMETGEDNWIFPTSAVIFAY